MRRRGEGSTRHWRCCSRAGIAADGFVVDADPADAVRDALDQLEPPVDGDRRLDASGAEIRVAAPPRGRADREGGGRPPGRARRRRPRSRRRRGERARDRERDRSRRRPPRPDSRTGGPVACELHARLPAERSGDVPASGCRAPAAPCARGTARARASTPTARSRTRIRTPRPCTPFRTSASTRSSSRRFPARTKSSWLRKDVVTRLRDATKLPVEHVEVEPELVGAASR